MNSLVCSKQNLAKVFDLAKWCHKWLVPGSWMPPKRHPPKHTDTQTQTKSWSRVCKGIFFWFSVLTPPKTQRITSAFRVASPRPSLSAWKTSTARTAGLAWDLRGETSAQQRAVLGGTEGLGGFVGFLGP